MSTPTVVVSLIGLSLMLGNVSGQSCSLSKESRHVEGLECVCCKYNVDSIPPSPEVLWATSQRVALRARVACHWSCRRVLNWFYFRIDEASGKPGQQKNEGRCFGKEFCELNDTIPGSRIMVKTGFWSDETQSHKFSDSNAVVSVCPARPPPPPSDVICEHRGGVEQKPQLRWRHRPERACGSYAHFVVKTMSPDRRNWRPWRWLGEASPDNRTHGGDVHPCTDDPTLLCADLSLADRGVIVQLGIRRADENNTDDSIAKYKEVECPTPNVTPRTSETPLAVPSVPTEGTAPAPAGEKTASSQPPRARASSGHWRLVALVLGCALVAVVALLPLVFYAGRRWEKKKGGVAAWQHLKEYHPFPPLPPRSDGPLPYDEVPPVYTYDYVSGPGAINPRSPMPPPVPKFPKQSSAGPAPSITPYAEVLNDMYNPSDPSGGHSLR